MVLVWKLCIKKELNILLYKINILSWVNPLSIGKSLIVIKVGSWMGMPKAKKICKDIITKNNRNQK